jgi:hypothetical protein
VEIHVLQGEAETVMSPGVKSLGRFHLTGIPPAPRGMPQIEVGFDIDANGIVNVSAKDLATGKEQAMTITGGTALSKDEIDRMMKEAEAFAAEDHKRREAAEARNQADQLTYQVDTFLKDNGDKLPDADKVELTSKNDELKQALKEESAETETLRSASEALMQAWQKVSQTMHEQAAQAQSAAQVQKVGHAGQVDKLRKDSVTTKAAEPVNAAAAPVPQASVSPEPRSHTRILMRPGESTRTNSTLVLLGKASWSSSLGPSVVTGAICGSSTNSTACGFPIDTHATAKVSPFTSTRASSASSPSQTTGIRSGSKIGAPMSARTRSSSSTSTTLSPAHRSAIHS